MANFKLPMWCHYAQTCKEMCTIGYCELVLSQLQGTTGVEILEKEANQLSVLLYVKCLQQCLAHSKP